MDLKLALLGCGAIAKEFYVPALLSRFSTFENLWVVDPSKSARETVAMSLSGSYPVASLEEIPSKLDGVIVAAPNHLHYPLALQALSLGAHVLVEKPIVIELADGHALVEQARNAGRWLAVNQTRRFFPVTNKLKQDIASGRFGALKKIVHSEGVRLRWPFESGAAFAPSAKRTGVVMDLGVHVLDFYWYLFGREWRVDRALHDGFAGPEGLAEIALSDGAVTMEIRLSRYNELRNFAEIEFESGTVELHVHALDRFFITNEKGRQEIKVDMNTLADRPLGSLVVGDFLEACISGRPPICDAASTLPVIELLDRIYLQAGRYSSSIGSV